MKKIGWQKYETFLEEQVSSQFLSELLKKSFANIQADPEQEEYDQLAYEEEEQQEETPLSKLNIFPINDKIIEEALITTNFDCWVGHTNFNITQDIKDKLDKIDGIEVLKIMSRYRFFVGIGKMFEFKKVRNNIEKTLTKE